LSRNRDIESPPFAPFVGPIEHGYSFMRRVEKSRSQFFRIGQSDPESLNKYAGLVTTARVSRVEAILR
jgi:hypothetical protein